VSVDASKRRSFEALPRFGVLHWDDASRKWLLLPRLNEGVDGLAGTRTLRSADHALL